MARDKKMRPILRGRKTSRETNLVQLRERKTTRRLKLTRTTYRPSAEPREKLSMELTELSRVSVQPRK